MNDSLDFDAGFDTFEFKKAPATEYSYGIKAAAKRSLLIIDIRLERQDS